MATSIDPTGLPQWADPDVAGGSLLERTARHRRFVDRFATAGVAAGGFAVIASILGILAFLLIEVWPLARPPLVERLPAIHVAGRTPVALAVDEHRTHVATLGLDGVVRIYSSKGALALEKQLLGPDDPPLVSAAAPSGDSTFVATTSDGRLHIVPIAWTVRFRGSEREVVPELGETITLALDPAQRPLGAATARLDLDAGRAVAAAQLADGSVALVQRELEKSFLSGEATEKLTRSVLAPVARLTTIVVDRSERTVYAGTEDGKLISWDLREAGTPAATLVDAGGVAVTALELLIGDRSILVGQQDGRVSIWFKVAGEGGARPALTRVRDVAALPESVRLIAPSSRNRSFLVQDAGGNLALYYATSGRQLWAGRSPAPDAAGMAFSPRGDGAFLADADRIDVLSVDDPHPEASLRSLFAPIWYEGYGKPELVWQSSSGTDDFEPKLSLTPLLFGTLKGTFYALVLALPLAVLGAMYTSQFMHPRLQRYVKPSVELMASLPSVVLGFLAGLWLAPRVETAFTGIVLCGIVLPLCAILGGFTWSLLPPRLRARLQPGTEVFWYAVLVAAGLWLCIHLSPSLESVFFGGSFPQWLLDSFGMRYDQRNAVVVGLAMGFAVIPIIFAISEDAFSNVPQHLTAASLALGASRWQTVTRVVLPTASPGIFSAVMVGFGRAVGETMIVLMATGNTPITDWSPFNGFRTLSANVAVEIPEAPAAGTLYRTLFLAALLLFALTFVLNTLAEVVRQRLRQRYARL
jgi:phosphate transport system permease protein